MPPIFEHQCPKCHKIEEHLVLSGIPPKIYVCNTCNVVTEKIISASSFAFKGTGFYKTDYPKRDK